MPSKFRQCQRSDLINVRPNIDNSGLIWKFHVYISRIIPLSVQQTSFLGFLKTLETSIVFINNYPELQIGRLNRIKSKIVYRLIQGYIYFPQKPLISPTLLAVLG